MSLMWPFELGGEQWAFVEWGTPAPTGWRRASSGSPARRVLREAAASPAGRSALRATCPASVDDRSMTRWIENAVERGTRVLLHRPYVQPALIPPPKRAEVQDAEATPELTFVAFQLLDLEGRPIAGERYEVRLPDGSTRTGTLDDQGSAREDDVAPPGACEVRFPGITERFWQYGWGR
jgi:hypothetical protein